MIFEALTNKQRKTKREMFFFSLKLKGYSKQSQSMSYLYFESLECFVVNLRWQVSLYCKRIHRLF